MIHKNLILFKKRIASCDIPAKMFKGLTHPNFQFLDQMHLDKKSNIWQITFHANKPILFKYKQSAKQLVFSDKTCAPIE